MEAVLLATRRLHLTTGLRYGRPYVILSRKISHWTPRGLLKSLSSGTAYQKAAMRQEDLSPWHRTAPTLRLPSEAIPILLPLAYHSCRTVPPLRLHRHSQPNTRRRVGLPPTLVPATPMACTLRALVWAGRRASQQLPPLKGPHDRSRTMAPLIRMQCTPKMSSTTLTKSGLHPCKIKFQLASRDLVKAIIGKSGPMAKSRISSGPTVTWSNCPLTRDSRRRVRPRPRLWQCRRSSVLLLEQSIQQHQQPRREW